MDDFWSFFHHTSQQAVLIVLIASLVHYHDAHFVKSPRNGVSISGETYLQELLRHGHATRIYNLLRMPLHTFNDLCIWLQANTDLQDSCKKSGVSTVEKLAIFLVITGHGWSYRDVEERFQHSLETISR
jgi:hypothetical protein